jgi:hypothetical protein
MQVPAVLTQKFGPLPGWAWGGLGLGVALAVASWRKNQADSAENEDGVVVEDYALPDTLQPTYVFQNYDQDRTYVTVPQAPPAGGRPPDPVTPPVKPPVKPPVVTPPKPPVVPPKPAPKPPAAPKGAWVTVVPYKSGQPKGTPSTISGIAQKVYGKSTSALWSQIWNAPQNATLKKKRGAMNKIQPGDKVWVPK